MDRGEIYTTHPGCVDRQGLKLGVETIGKNDCLQDVFVLVYLILGHGRAWGNGSEISRIQ